MSDNKLYAVIWIAMAVMILSVASCDAVEKHAMYKYKWCEQTK